VPPQLVSDEGQTQLPPLQVVPPVQTVAQPPQWLSSVMKSAHDPEHSFGALAGQPKTQSGPASVGPHTGSAPLHVLWQAPQFPWLERSTSHPSDGVVEQWA
jgi:hypothetical protein